MLTLRSQAFGLLAVMLLTLSGCSGGSGSSGSSEATGTSASSGSAPGSVPAVGSGKPLVVSGSVGDGPVVDAALEVVDADGRVLGTDRSSATADYRLELPLDTRLPVLVTATGGTDLVTDRPLDFPLIGAVLSAGSVTVNVSPLTTLAVRAAQCSVEGLGAAGLERAWQVIYKDMSFGLDDGVVADPMNNRVTAINVGTLVLANEALGEAVRRTESRLAMAGVTVDGAEILRQVGCDLVSGRRTGALEPRVLATFRAAELVVRLETLAGRLEVDGYSATERMDLAIRTIRPEAQVPSVADLPIPQSARLQAQKLLGSWLDRLPFTRVVTLASLLATRPLESLGAAVDSVLDAPTLARMQGLPLQVAQSDVHEIQAMTERLEAAIPQAPPVVSLAASRNRIQPGDSVTLSWAAAGADLCQAGGAWSGLLDIQGARQIAGLLKASTFRLTCANSGGIVEKSVSVALEDAPLPTEPAPVPEPVPIPVPAPAPEPAPIPVPAPAPEPVPIPVPAPLPSLQLRAGASTVAQGGSTALTWTSTSAESCSASGGWSGARPTAGSQTVGPLQKSTTFSLSCVGRGGTAMAMISVTVNGLIALRWQAPTLAVDGRPLAGLAGYRIHVGLISRQYTDVKEIRADVGGAYSLSLSSGTYYLAMTAIGLDGAESAYSNEVVRIVQ